MSSAPRFTFALPSMPEGGALALLMPHNAALSGVAAAHQATLAPMLEAAEFTGKAESLVLLHAPFSGISQLLVAGLGNSGAPLLSYAKAGAAIRAKLAKSKLELLTLDASGLSLEQATQLVYGARLRAYRFDRYKTRSEGGKGPSEIRVLHPEANALEAACQDWMQIAAGVDLARDLVNEPGNQLYPESYVARIKQELPPLGIEVEVLDEAEMERLGFGALLGVGQGSARDSALVVMRWQGAADAAAAPVAFVGKGVTFDTGGISLKPANGMEDMTMDMGGSAAVVGAMRALAGRQAKVNAVGVIGLVENMPDGNAQRPGDIVTSLSGQTIQVLNTDAEGRLVLADALWYTQDRFKPQFMVDLATLTGAMLVALGTEKAGLFANNNELAERLLAAGEATGDYLWRMPLGDEYNKLLDSPLADVKNISNGRWGGAITAACFLERFVNQTVWAHLDIAPTVDTAKEKVLVGKGATGFGVQLLDRLVAAHYETE